MPAIFGLCLLGAPGASGCAVDDHETMAADTEGAQFDEGSDDDASAHTDERFECALDYEVLGQVDGVFASQGDYSVRMEFSDRFERDVPVGPDVPGYELLAARMGQMGLDASDPDDQERYFYLRHGAELVNSFTEYVDEGFFGTIGRDLSITVYDLAEHGVQPGGAIAIFDVSSIEELRNEADRSALGDAIREIVDEMRSNGQPDAVVAFAPDRSEEPTDDIVLDVMFSQSARFATAGTLTVDDLRLADGAPIDALDDPLADIAWASIDVEGELAGNPLLVSAQCLPVTVTRS